MGRPERMELIKSIQKERSSRLITYITGDRQGLETKIADDVFPMFHQHLEKTNNKKIDLFLYTTGGLTIAGYALVNLFREFCEEFNVIIPFRALSCGTLISLGANEIVMTKMGQLSPIDPSVHHPLGPVVQIPGQPMARIAPVNVEDVNAFINLAKDELGLKEEDSIKKVFEILSSKINPIVLGAVHRSREEIAFLASILMKYHIKDEERIKKTVETLTRERFSHSYKISRREAQEELGLNIIEPDENLTTLIINLFNAYNDILKMDQPYNQEVVLGTDSRKVEDFNRAIIESDSLTHVFRTKKEIIRIQQALPGMPQPVLIPQERTLQQEWTVDNTI